MMMISSSRTRLLLLALVAVVMAAAIALNNADAGAPVPGDATCNGIVNETDLLPALEEFAGIGEGSGCPENVNVICTDPSTSTTSSPSSASSPTSIPASSCA